MLQLSKKISSSKSNLLDHESEEKFEKLKKELLQEKTDENLFFQIGCLYQKKKNRYLSLLFFSQCSLLNNKKVEDKIRDLINENNSYFPYQIGCSFEEKNHKDQAFKYFLLASTYKNKEAMYKIISYYEEDNSFFNSIHTIDAFNTLSNDETNDPKIQYLYSNYLEKNNKIDQSVKFLEKSALKEYPDACFKLAEKIKNDPLTNLNYLESLYEFGAKQNHPLCLISLGKSYLKGKFTKINIRSALKYFSKV